jgi:Tol biopolymer transport system component
LALLVTAIGAQTHAPAAPGPSKAWKLAFVRDGDIWIANGDGTGQRRLIRKGVSPCWSPDRKQIAFARDSNIWIANADGTGQRQLTSAWKKTRSDEDETISLSWNPVDNLITFSHEETYSVRPQRGGAVQKIDGSALYAVSPTAERSAEPEVILDIGEQGAHYAYSHQDSPAWSKSGKWLAFARNGDIWTATRYDRRKEGSLWDAWKWQISRLAAAARFDDPNSRASRTNLGVARLSWSPDEKSLAYSLTRLDGSGVWEIHLLRVEAKPDDGEPTVKKNICLTNNGFDACFSPDSRSLTFVNTEGIHLLTTDSKTERILIKNARQPAW